MSTGTLPVVKELLNRPKGSIPQITGSTERILLIKTKHRPRRYQRVNIFTWVLVLILQEVFSREEDLSSLSIATCLRMTVIIVSNRFYSLTAGPWCHFSSTHDALVEQNPEITFVTLFTIKATRREEILAGRIKSLIEEATLGSILCAYLRDAMSRMYQVNPEFGDWVEICMHSPLKESAHLRIPREKNKRLIALLTAQKTSDDDLGEPCTPSRPRRS